MAYLVPVVAGDSLCRVARRNGFSNCGTLRADPANALLLDRPLVPGVDQVTIPQILDRWVPIWEALATGRRHLFTLTQAVRLAIAASFVRTASTPPSAADAITDIGISRFPTAHVDIDKATAFPDHNVRNYHAAAFADPNAFNVEVVDPNVPGGDVSVVLEALQPIYLGHAVIGQQRFAAGVTRTARSLVVALSPIGLPRRRSCYLRLVVDREDRNRLPQQTLLVSDAVADGDEVTEILDQRIRARYEDAICDRPVGERCLLAAAEIPLRRGHRVDVTGRILRVARSGIVEVVEGGPGDDGIVPLRTLRHRVLVNARRVWAQQEITFELTTLETVDPPSEMLTVGEPAGVNASGLNLGGAAPGQVGFTVDVHPHHGVAVQHVVAPVGITAGWTPTQTATALAAALGGIPNLVATVSPNPAVQGNAAGSADLVLNYPNAWVAISNLTPGPLQDAQQKVERVAVDPANLLVRAGISNAYAGSPMQRALYKAFATNPQGINLFVVQALGGILAIAHTLNAQGAMLGAHQPLPEMQNCIVLSRETVDPNLTLKPYTLAHEMGHAIMDNAEHCLANDDFESLMRAATSDDTSGGDLTKRISSVADDWYVVVDQGHVDVPDNHVPAMGLRGVNTDMPALIAANGTMTFHLR